MRHTHEHTEIGAKIVRHVTLKLHAHVMSSNFFWLSYWYKVIICYYSFDKVFQFVISNLRLFSLQNRWWWSAQTYTIKFVVWSSETIRARYFSIEKCSKNAVVIESNEFFSFDFHEIVAVFAPNPVAFGQARLVKWNDTIWSSYFIKSFHPLWHSTFSALFFHLSNCD